MKPTELGQLVLEMATVDDTQYSEAIRNLRAAAPQLTDLILALESAASAYALSYAESAFCLGVSVATQPCGWLVE